MEFPFRFHRTSGTLPPKQLALPEDVGATEERGNTMLPWGETEIRSEYAKHAPGHRRGPTRSAGQRDRATSTVTSLEKELTKPCPGFPRQAGLPKPMLNACKTSFLTQVAFPYLVALAKIQKRQGKTHFLSKECVGFNGNQWIWIKKLIIRIRIRIIRSW